MGIIISSFCLLQLDNCHDDVGETAWYVLSITKVWRVEISEKCDGYMSIFSRSLLEGTLDNFKELKMVGSWKSLRNTLGKYQLISIAEPPWESAVTILSWFLWFHHSLLQEFIFYSQYSVFCFAIFKKYFYLRLKWLIFSWIFRHDDRWRSGHLPSWMGQCRDPAGLWKCFRFLSLR